MRAVVFQVEIVWFVYTEKKRLKWQCSHAANADMPLTMCLKYSMLENRVHIDGFSYLRRNDCTSGEEGEGKAPLAPCSQSVVKTLLVCYKTCLYIFSYCYVTQLLEIRENNLLHVVVVRTKNLIAWSFLISVLNYCVIQGFSCCYAALVSVQNFN